MRRPVALTGTPGTGKSAVARRLADSLRVVEVGDLALALGTGRRRGRGIEVDLRRLVQRLHESDMLCEYDLVVGHLAHLLPLRDVVVLRCHPSELARRLARAHRGTPPERRANVESEALDVILWEAIAPGGRRVWEVDTTGQSIAGVTRRVASRCRVRGRSDFGEVDWLADPRVTEGLLDRAR